MSKTIKPNKQIIELLYSFFHLYPSDLIWMILEYLEFTNNRGFFLWMLHDSGSIQDFVREQYTLPNFRHKFFTFIGGKPKECTMEYWFIVSILKQIKWNPTLKQKLATLVPRCESKGPVYPWNKCLNPKCDKEMSTERFLKLFQERYGKYFMENTEKKTETRNTICPTCLHTVVFQKLSEGSIPFYVVLALILKLTHKCSTQKVHYNGIKCPGDGCDHGQASGAYIPGFQQGNYDRLCQCCQYKWFADNALGGKIPIEKCPKYSIVHHIKHRSVKEVPECSRCLEKFTCCCY